ncbi:piggyBac transposable element-derived protein 2-like [Schistocerca cancellata]|uniref:piggyBac transposable element-derived protein 2-like n=1 Tax=Schistocerca cancellata TaxID=274614 RepID=UPI00211979FF|nr:piggyBac transposable element-derived protein 2-like [Schistocerca cancellata]
MGIQSLGTVRPNRLKGCMFTSDKVMKKKGRGSYEEHLSKIDGITLSAVKWYDNKPVHLLSTFAGAHPTSTVERWDRTKKEKINVECPSIVHYYNQFMGGVDPLDSLIALYRIKIRSKKWYLRIVFHLLDLTVVNAWLLYRRDCTECNVRKLDQLSLLDFKATVAACLCKQNKDGQKKRGSPSSSSMETAIQLKKKTGSAAPLPEKEVRKDGIGHWPQFSEKRGRCKKPGYVDKDNISASVNTSGLLTITIRLIHITLSPLATSTFPCPSQAILSTPLSGFETVVSAASTELCGECSIMHSLQAHLLGPPFAV